MVHVTLGLYCISRVCSWYLLYITGMLVTICIRTSVFVAIKTRSQTADLVCINLYIAIGCCVVAASCTLYSLYIMNAICCIAGNTQTVVVYLLISLLFMHWSLVTGLRVAHQRQLRHLRVV